MVCSNVAGDMRQTPPAMLCGDLLDAIGPMTTGLSIVCFADRTRAPTKITVSCLTSGGFVRAD